MDRRKELKEEYKNRKIQTGIYCIKNPMGESLFLGAAADLTAMSNRLRFQLKWDTNLTPVLRENVKHFGAEQLTFEVLETLKTEEKTNDQIGKELDRALQKWQQALHKKQ